MFNFCINVYKHTFRAYDYDTQYTLNLAFEVQSIMEESKPLHFPSRKQYGHVVFDVDIFPATYKYENDKIIDVSEGPWKLYVYPWGCDTSSNKLCLALSPPTKYHVRVNCYLKFIPLNEFSEHLMVGSKKDIVLSDSSHPVFLSNILNLSPSDFTRSTTSGIQIINQVKDKESSKYVSADGIIQFQMTVTKYGNISEGAGNFYDVSGEAAERHPGNLLLV